MPFTPAYQGWVESIVRRIGTMETCRRLGIHDKTLRVWRGRQKGTAVPKRIHREYASQIVKVMGELRQTGEVRHRLSIVRGATIRGESERRPERPRDFYVGGSDLESEQARVQRKRP